MNTRVWLYSIIIVLALAAFMGFAIHRQQLLAPKVAANVKNSTMVLYYGRECPHCKHVEDFMATNKTHQKLKFVEKEVFHNRTNLLDMVSKTKACHMDVNTLVVPFLWTGHTCLVGDQPIINYFKQLENHHAPNKK